MTKKLPILLLFASMALLVLVANEPAEAHLTLSGDDGYIWSGNCGTTTRNQPVNLIFSGVTYESELVALMGAILPNWSIHGGTDFNFSQDNKALCSQQDLHLATGPATDPIFCNDRDHIRLKQGHGWDSIYGRYYLGAVHHDTCCPIPLSPDFHHGELFNETRDVIANAFRAAGYPVTYIDADNELFAEQAQTDAYCGPDRGDGNVAAIWSKTQRVSVDSAGSEGNGGVSPYSVPSFSADARYVTFDSDATNMVPQDTNGYHDVFVHDRLTGTTERASLSSIGSQTNGGSYDPVISADGRYVAFESVASNLGATSSNGYLHIYVHDRQTHITERVSVNSAGTQANAGGYGPVISADGRYVAFDSEASNLVAGDTNSCDFPIGPTCYDVFLRDRQTGTTERVSVSGVESQANDNSGDPAISADGRYVAFSSGATNLVSGDTNAASDVFVRDRQAGDTVRVSVDSDGDQNSSDSYAPHIDADGLRVAFSAEDSNLIAGDTNGYTDAFVHDRFSGITEAVSVSNDGNLGDGYSYAYGISGDGRYVTIESAAQNLVPVEVGFDNYFDVFVRDRLTNITARVSVNGAGDQGNDHSYQPAIDSSGRYVGFKSWSASNLVPGDTNGSCEGPSWGCVDVFVRDLGDGDTDGQWDPFDVDADSDGDRVFDPTESKCGSDPLSAASIPERVDLPADDDGDALVDEALPPGSQAYDCDGDGFVGMSEMHVFSAGGTANDQDACGGTGWPADLVPGGFQPNALNIQDLGSYIAPLRRLNTSLGDAGFDVRWDIVPGNSALPKTLNIVDLGAFFSGATGFPPMLGAQRAYNRVCPWAPWRSG